VGEKRLIGVDERPDEICPQPLDFPHGRSLHFGAQPLEFAHVLLKVALDQAEEMVQLLFGFLLLSLGDRSLEEDPGNGLPVEH